MSDSHIYELQDIVWDDFPISDDHLVPHSEIEPNERSAIQTESHKRLKHEIGMTSGTGSHGVELAGVATENTSPSSAKVKSEQMLANGSWSHSPDAFQTYNDLVTSLSSEGPTTVRGDFTSNNNFYTDDLAPTNNCTAADNNIAYSMRDAPQPESDLSFFYNGHENKETDDPLFYDWPEIENFEDVDQMLRFNMTCDSTFGLGDLAEEDDMCWFPSSTAVHDSDAASKSEVRSSYSDSNSLKILSENNESPQSNYESPAVGAFKRSAGASYTPSSLASNTTEQSCLSKVSSINGLPTNSDQAKPLKEVTMHVRNMEHQTQSVETNVSLHQFDSSSTQLSFMQSSQKLFSTNCSGLQKQNESFNKNSQLDEKSLGETSFRQLREVMDQLDLKTKLCIRDSFYRLAKSAEQRHSVATMNRFNKAEKNSSEVLIAEARHAGLLNIETDTNPIDRSIAHLLFHRPIDPSKMPLSNTQPGTHLNIPVVDMSNSLHNIILSLIPHSRLNPIKTDEVQDMMYHDDFNHVKLPWQERNDITDGHARSGAQFVVPYFVPESRNPTDWRTCCIGLLIQYLKSMTQPLWMDVYPWKLLLRKPSFSF